ncbi:MAG: ATP-dependent DNA ligase [Nanoarchaeota archaeon]
MHYSTLAKIYEELESTTKRLEKRDTLAELYRKCKQEELALIVTFSTGYADNDLGIARELMRRIIARTYGASESEVTKKFNETGDLGLSAEYFAKHRKQVTLSKKELTIQHVHENLQKLPKVTGQGSVDKKISLVAELLSSVSPIEAKFIVRTVLGDMRIGVAEGVVRDAIAKAFDKDSRKIEKLFDVTGNYGKVAELAKKGKLKAKIEVGRPVRVMLAARSPGLKEALEEFENPALEIKYDGFRLAIHKEGSEVWLYSRMNENVTVQFPEIVELARKYIKARDCITEGEVLVIDEKGNPRPFQTLSRRIQRKYDIKKKIKEIPVQINLFDLIYLNGKSLMDAKLRERWNKLKSIIKQQKGKFQLAGHIETKNLREAEKFYDHSLSMGQEGLMVKNLDAHYQPGRRVGYWLKVKPIMEPLDLVIVGAEWGEGKRARWLGSLLLACRDRGKFLSTGQMASGLTERQLEELTRKLKPIIEDEHKKDVKVKPQVVVEVAYEEIQRSPKYPTGYALRFPRLLRIRDPKDKGPQDVNTLTDIEKLFKMQRRFH